MIRLLVSIRNASEAAAALAGGADFIDVKEPARGALGFADASTLRAIAAAIGHRVLLSAALGEISAPLPPDSFAALADYNYAKLGLAGAREIPDWPLRWRQILAQLPPSVHPVAVAYADWQTCGAPSPVEVLHQARAVKCGALLVDTFAKQGSTIFDFISCEALADVLAVAREQGLLTLVAGSLRRCDLPQVAALSPDAAAVRGAVCAGGRAGRVEAALVAEFRRELARNSHVRGVAPSGKVNSAT